MTLRDALFDLAQSARARRPAEAQHAIDTMLDELRRSGIDRSCLQVGEAAPDFTLSGPDGRPLSLDAVLQHGPAVVMFYRGGWCPYCNLALGAMDGALPALRRLGTTVLAISPQRPDAIRAMAAKHSHQFALLSDRDNRVARLFGLAFPLPDPIVAMYRNLGIDLPAENGTAGWELPLPATFVVARDFTVAYAHIDIDYTRRAEPGEIVAAVERLAKEPVP